jgi:hypothetical protein
MKTILPGVLLSCLMVTAAHGAAEAFKVTTDKTVDSTSLESIIADVYRLSGAKTNDEKAIAIHNYLHSAIFHNAYPTEKKPQSVGPLKVINTYGWGLCGGQHTVLKALFETAGWQVRYRGWSNPGHTTIEVNYDGKWHYFDTFLKAYWWTKDKKTIAGQDDIVADPSIVLDGQKDGRVPVNYLSCGDTPDGCVTGCKNSKANAPSAHKDGWASVTGRDQDYNPLLKLPSGASLKLDWAGVSGGVACDGGKGIHSCGIKDYRNDPVLGAILEHYGPRNFSNGTVTYAPDFSKAADVKDVELSGAQAQGGKLVASGKGAALFKLDLPHAFVSAKLAATFSGDGKLSTSVDGGKTWAAAAAGDIAAAVRQKYSLWVKAEFTGDLSNFSIEGVVEHNRHVLPYLLPGKNAITVSTKDNKLPDGTVLTVTYTFQETTAPAKRKQYNAAGLTYGETKTVTKEITALPFNFDLEVGGKSPPKMLALQRSIKGK